MLERALEQRWTMSKILSNPELTPKREHRNLDLHNEQWELMAELVKVLKPLEIATTLFCSDQQVSLSCVFPILFRLLTIVEPADKEIPAIKQTKAEIKQQINTRWDLDKIDTSSPFVLSAALDPRFKNMGFLSVEENKAVMDTLINMGKKLPLSHVVPTSEPGW
jgi:hypothetical protein